MVAVRVVLVLIKQCADLGCGDLAVLLRQREHLVPAELDGTSLMQTDMARICRDDTLIRRKQRVDDRRIRLRAADEEIDIGVRALAGRPNFRARRFADGVRAIARHGRAVRLGQTLQDGRMRAFHIVRCKW